jgi:hypothetical protein
MGRARSNRSNSPLPISTSDPAHPTNLKRSLARNDVELAALSKLHVSLRLLRDAIVSEFGEDGLIDIVLSHQEKLKNGGLSPPSSATGAAVDVQPEKLTMDKNDDNDVHHDTSLSTNRREKLSAAFFLRMKLRRRLLNRLARRLHRVAHVMDNNGSSRGIDAPIPPRYGDQMRRFVKDDEDGNPIIMSEGAKNIRVKDAEDFEAREGEKFDVKCTLVEQRRQRLYGAAAMIEDEEGEEGGDEIMMDVDTPSPLELLLKHDEEDRPLLDKLVEHEVDYDKVYTLGKPKPPPLSSPPKKSKNKGPIKVNNDGDDKKEQSGGTPSSEQKKDVDTPKQEDVIDKDVVTMTLPIVDTVDTHDIGHEGGGGENAAVVDNAHILRVPYSVGGRAPPSMDYAADWKRWTKEICDRIPDQVTFDDLGVGGDGVIFELEARLDASKRKAAGADDVTVNRGKGKVLRREVPEGNMGTTKSGGDDGDVKMTESGKDDGNEQTKENAPDGKDDLPAKNSKSFSVKPVPSFYHQDLLRVKIIQNELVRHANTFESREILQLATQAYDSAYKASVALQHAKAKLNVEKSKMTNKHQYNLAGLQQQGKHQVAQARAHWERRQWHLRDAKKNYGEEGALVRGTCNDVLQEAKDRLVVRFEHTTTSGGSPKTARASFIAKQEGDKETEEVANVLGKIVDCVDRRYLDMLYDHTESFIPPPVATENTVIANPETGETLAEMQLREKNELDAQQEKLDAQFVEAEKKRTAAWAALSKAKQGAEVGAPTTKARKPARQSYPTQQQQYHNPTPSGQQVQQYHQYQYLQQQQMQQQQMIVAQARIAAQQRQQQQQALAYAQAQVVQAPTNDVPKKVHVPLAGEAADVCNDDSSLTQDGPKSEKKMTQNERYGYGDRYSQANVDARKCPDGTVFPVQQPKLLPNGEFARPSGRQRKGMDWDAKRGCWFPVPDGEGEN